MADITVDPSVDLNDEQLDKLPQKVLLRYVYRILKGVNGGGVIDRLERVEHNQDDHQKWHLNNRLMVLVAVVCSLIGLVGVLFGILA